MRKTVFALIAFVSLKTHAVTWKVYGPCDENPAFQGEVAGDMTRSVGATSIEIFDNNKVPYIGAAEGFNSILHTPVGLESLELVSKTEMRAYGWCYSVNGNVPTEMPHEVFFKSPSDVLIWFYAYNTYRNGEWMDDYCSPAYWVKAKQFCELKK